MSGTTELARRISEDPRFIGDTGEFFREIASEHGEDTAGVAWMQALLRLAQTRRRALKVKNSSDEGQ